MLHSRSSPNLRPESDRRCSMVLLFCESITSLRIVLTSTHTLLCLHSIAIDLITSKVPYCLLIHSGAVYFRVVHIGDAWRFSILMGNIGKATEPCISIDWYINSQLQPTQKVTDIFLTVPSSLTLEMIQIRNLYSFMYRQHVYDLEKRRGDCLMKWLIMLGFIDLRGPRVCWCSTPVL